ncbi:unnamed protein product [Effrenium voratum]|nr:unnamed protein product [Effrenium voratum]
MAGAEAQIQEEMLAAITAKALPVAAAACAEVCSRHLAALHHRLQQLQVLQQQVQQLQTQPAVQAAQERQAMAASRSSRSASPLRRALEFTNSAVAFPVMQEVDASPFSLGCITPVTPLPDGEGTDKVLSVMKRVRSAVRRSRQSPEQLFKRFCKAGVSGASGLIMTRSDFFRVLGTFEPNLEQEMVLRLWQYLIAQGRGEDGLNYIEFQRWFVNGEGFGTLTRTGSSSTSLSFNGYDTGHGGGYLDADRPATAPCVGSPVLGARRLSQSRPPVSPSTSPAFFTNMRSGAMTLPIPSRSCSQGSLEVYIGEELALARRLLLALGSRTGRGAKSQRGQGGLFHASRPCVAMPRLVLLTAFGAAAGSESCPSEGCGLSLIQVAKLSLTWQQCEDLCRHTIACTYFLLDGHQCLTYSGEGSGPKELRPLRDHPWRCSWPPPPQGLGSLEGAQLQRRLLDEELHRLWSPTFADCPVGGAALRLLHLWAAASYHHGWRPTVAFAFEEPELPMAPELRLVLDVPWGKLLKSAWAKPLWQALAQIALSFCQRLQASRAVSVCFDSATAGCDANAAATLLERNVSDERLAAAQALVAGCGARLGALLRASGAAELFARLAGLAARKTAEPRPEDAEDVEECTGATRPVELQSLAVRQEVVHGELAALALAASQRTCRHHMRLVDVLAFMERQATQQVSGFFNEITENRCEMDYFSHFHQVFCLGEGRVTPAFMTSGLLVHPPYGPAAWSCRLPRKPKNIELRLIDPMIWATPLTLMLRPERATRYSCAICPQPLYRLESNQQLLEDWLQYHQRMGVQHWTIYDLDGSGAPFLANRSGIEFISNLPEILGSPRLAEGNRWNPICLEAIALTQCFWRYRGRSDLVFVLHSFDEFLMSGKHQQNGLPRFKSAIAHENATVFRLPAVNYGGPSESSPHLPARFRWHTGKLYWHVAAAQPDHVLAVNTTSAWPEPPRRMANFFQPELLRVNHYIDALGPRSGSQVFKHQDHPKLMAWAIAALSERSRGRSLVGPAAVAARYMSPAEGSSLADSVVVAAGRMPPIVRVAFGMAEVDEEQYVLKVLSDGFWKGDLDSDGLWSKEEFEAFAQPQGWDAHLRRRDLHYIGLFLHSWASPELFAWVDADLDSRLTSAEWSEGMLWLVRRRELNATAQQLLRLAEACEHHSIPISRNEAEELSRAKEMIVAMNHVLVEKHGSSI